MTRKSTARIRWMLSSVQHPCSLISPSFKLCPGNRKWCYHYHKQGWKDAVGTGSNQNGLVPNSGDTHLLVMILKPTRLDHILKLVHWRLETAWLQHQKAWAQVHHRTHLPTRPHRNSWTLTGFPFSTECKGPWCDSSFILQSLVAPVPLALAHKPGPFFITATLQLCNVSRQTALPPAAYPALSTWLQDQLTMTTNKSPVFYNGDLLSCLCEPQLAYLPAKHKIPGVHTSAIIYFYFYFYSRQGLTV